MATYTIQAPDGRKIKLEGPENATNEQLSVAAKEAYAKIVENEKPATEQPSGETDLGGVTGAILRGAAPIVSGMAAGGAMGAPIGLPAHGALAGGGAMALSLAVADPITKSVNNLLGTDYKMPSQALSDLFTRLGVAEPDSEAERVIQTASQAVGDTAGTIGLGSVLQLSKAPAVSELGRMLASTPTQQMVGAATGGASQQSAKEAGLGEGAQLAAGLVGGMGGAQLASPRTMIAATPEKAATAIKNAEDLGIDVLSTDVKKPQTFIGKSFQALGERIPVIGTGGERKEQNIQRISAIRGLLNEYGANDAANASDNVIADLLEKRRGDLFKYSSNKNQVIESLSDKGAVNVDRTVNAIDKEIQKLSKNAGTEEIDAVINDLSSLQKNIVNKDLSAIEQQRELLGAKYAKPELTSARNIAEKSLSNIYAPLREDMGDFIKANGQNRDYHKWSIANKRLSSMYRDLDMAAFKSTLNKGDVTPGVINKMLFSKDPAEVKMLYSKLTPNGRASARVAILDDAYQKSSIESPEGFVLSPDKFLSNVKKNATSTGVFFSGDDFKRLDGLTKALELTKRASEAGVMTKTGQEGVPYLAGAGLTTIFGPKGAVGAAITTGALARAYESKPMRDMLIKLPTLKKGSPEELALAKRIISTLQTNTQEEK